MVVLIDDIVLKDFVGYVESLLYPDTQVNDGMVASVMSYLLTDLDIPWLLKQYNKGHVTSFEQTIAELLIDECQQIYIDGFLRSVRAHIQEQLGISVYSELKLNRGFILVKF